MGAQPCRLRSFIGKGVALCLRRQRERCSSGQCELRLELLRQRHPGELSMTTHIQGALLLALVLPLMLGSGCGGTRRDGSVANAGGASGGMSSAGTGGASAGRAGATNAEGGLAA